MSLEFQQKPSIKKDVRIEIRRPEKPKPIRPVRKPEVEKKHIKQDGRR